jgi:phosphoglycolate phosphatase-like HAD superfamily hydrolase
MKRDAIILDMDGTLADVSSIRHHLRKYDATKRRIVKHFNKFHERSVDVPAHSHVVNAAQVAHILGLDILIVTARKHMWRHQTAWWLAMHGVPSDALFMRGNLDNRPDYEVKKDMLDTIRKQWNVIHAFDDNPSIIKLWTEEGISTTIVDGWEDG